MKSATPYLMASCVAFAATAVKAQQPGDEPGQPAEPPTLQQTNGIKYLNGGASEEDRERMRAQTADYPVRIALSGRGGEYLVAQTLTLANKVGRELASVPDAGPFVMFNLPPGDYTLDATLPDGRHERRGLSVGAGPASVDWSFATAAR